jgi:hypothetical protein
MKRSETPGKAKSDDIRVHETAITGNFQKVFDGCKQPIRNTSSCHPNAARKTSPPNRLLIRSSSHETRPAIKSISTIAATSSFQ